MLLESMPDEVDGLPDIGLPLRTESDDINNATYAFKASGWPSSAVACWAPSAILRHLRGASVKDVLHIAWKRAITEVLAVAPSKLEVPSTPELIALGAGGEPDALWNCH